MAEEPIEGNDPIPQPPESSVPLEEQPFYPLGSRMELDDAWSAYDKHFGGSESVTEPPLVLPSGTRVYDYDGPFRLTLTDPDTGTGYTNRIYVDNGFVYAGTKGKFYWPGSATDYVTFPSDDTWIIIMSISVDADDGYFTAVNQPAISVIADSSWKMINVTTTECDIILGHVVVSGGVVTSFSQRWQGGDIFVPVRVLYDVTALATCDTTTSAAGGNYAYACSLRSSETIAAEAYLLCYHDKAGADKETTVLVPATVAAAGATAEDDGGTPI